METTGRALPATCVTSSENGLAKRRGPFFLPDFLPSARKPVLRRPEPTNRQSGKGGMRCVEAPLQSGDVTLPRVCSKKSDGCVDTVEIAPHTAVRGEPAIENVLGDLPHARELRHHEQPRLVVLAPAA